MAAFTAFLCARLLDVSAEERAAHAIQRLWRTRASRAPGAARMHLQARLRIGAGKASSVCLILREGMCPALRMTGLPHRRAAVLFC